MADIRTAILITLDNAHEGGFQANPKDRANWTGGKVGVGTLVGTKYGVTTLDMPGVDIKNLTSDQAIAYYMENYVKPFYSQISDQALLNKIFDLGVLFGVGTAVKAIQRAVGTVAVDGQFGQQTLEAVNRVSPTSLLSVFQDEMAERARAIAASDPNDAPDLPDWIRRIYS